MNTILKQETSEKHKIAERKKFNVRMFRGELAEQDYLTYLEQQLYIFTALEKDPLPHDSLNRIKSINEDIVELTSKGSVLKGELHSTQNYTSYLSKLSAEEKQPHIYLHYLATLYGGQMMKSKVPSKGSFYLFNDVEECISSIRRIQKDTWVDEVNKGFDFMIDIFDSLEEFCFMNKNESND
jgi:heme oxygenase